MRGTETAYGAAGCAVRMQRTVLRDTWYWDSIGSCTILGTEAAYDAMGSIRIGNLLGSNQPSRA
eukprot:1838227-Rhodomonas_salina.1